MNLHDLKIFSVKAAGHTAWISDGSCDDANNNPFCNFDGGDCCGSDVRKQYCFDCLCLSKYVHKATEDEHGLLTKPYLNGVIIYASSLLITQYINIGGKDLSKEVRTVSL